MPRSITLAWDEGNREHATRHGVSLQEIEELVTYGIWVMAGERRLIGTSPRGRLVTLILQPTETPGVYRPVTSWPSTPAEINLYHQRRRQRRG